MPLLVQHVGALPHEKVIDDAPFGKLKRRHVPPVSIPRRLRTGHNPAEVVALLVFLVVTAVKPCHGFAGLDLDREKLRSHWDVEFELVFLSERVLPDRGHLTPLLKHCLQTFSSLTIKLVRIHGFAPQVPKGRPQCVVP